MSTPVLLDAPLGEKVDSWPRYARFLHLRPGIDVMEGVLCRLAERNNSSVRPGYAVLGGQFIPRVTKRALEARRDYALRGSLF